MTHADGSALAPDLAATTWIVMPLFNEAEVVGEVIAAVRETFPLIVCVDDGSTDGSGQIARDAGAAVVTHSINLGQGAALRTGIDYALRDPQMRCLVTFDSDGQHRVEDAVAMVRRLAADEADVVLGSRFLEGKSHAGLAKRLVLRLATAWTNLTLGLHLTDTHNGLRALSRQAAQGIVIEQNKMAHATEILGEIKRNRLRVVEQPVEILYTDYSVKKGQPILNAVNIVVDGLFR
jgi:polyprenyl-phospho-N-acetylgalactosaminyl synthase